MIKCLKSESSEERRIKKEIREAILQLTSLISRVPHLSEILLDTIPLTLKNRHLVFYAILNALKQYPDIKVLKAIHKPYPSSRNVSLEILSKCPECKKERKISIWNSGNDLRREGKGLLCNDCLNEILGPEENEEYLERPSAKEKEREAKERKEGEESLIKDTEIPF